MDASERIRQIAAERAELSRRLGRVDALRESAVREVERLTAEKEGLEAELRAKDLEFTEACASLDDRHAPAPRKPATPGSRADKESVRRVVLYVQSRGCALKSIEVSEALDMEKAETSGALWTAWNAGLLAHPRHGHYGPLPEPTKASPPGSGKA